MKCGGAGYERESAKNPLRGVGRAGRELVKTSLHLGDAGDVESKGGDAGGCDGEKEETGNEVHVEAEVERHDGCRV